jgi:manganese/zinc/iron transport system permease protein
VLAAHGVEIVSTGGTAAATATAAAAPTTTENDSARTGNQALAFNNALRRLVLLRDYNTRVVLAGTFVLGVSAGVVGVLLLLRKRALLGDVVSHAALPGIGIAFIVMNSISGNGKSLPVLLLGAALGGVAGVLCTSAIRRWTRIKDDAALAVVLSVFFGVGVALMSAIQKMRGGHQAGLGHFIYGKAASMMADDVLLIAGTAAVALLICVFLSKEFAAVAFDERFAAAEGWSIFGLDLLLMTLIVVVTVVGLQSVGLLLVVALLIVPPAAARFWTERLWKMLWIAGTLGGVSAVLGVAISALFPRVPTGAVIVLVGFALFLLSMLFGTERGVMRRLIILWQVRQTAGRQHLVRAFFERICGEQSAGSIDQLTGKSLSLKDLQPMRSWSPRRLRRLLAWAEREQLLERDGDRFRLTTKGAQMAARVVRNHRLWELYLIHFADVAPTHVDRDADEIEHILDAEMIAMLEARIGSDFPETPRSPHQITVSSSASNGTAAPEVSQGSVS